MSDTYKARKAVRAARHARDDAQRRVNVAQELADSQAHAIARRGSDCPPAFFVIYRQREDRLNRALFRLRQCRRAVSDAQQGLAAAQTQQRADELTALRNKLLGETA